MKIKKTAARGMASHGFGVKLSNAARATSVYGGSLRDHLGAQFRATLERQTPLGKF